MKEYFIKKRTEFIDGEYKKVADQITFKQE
jgi:hypothetical protein